MKDLGHKLAANCTPHRLRQQFGRVLLQLNQQHYFKISRYAFSFWCCCCCCCCCHICCCCCCQWHNELLPDTISAISQPEMIAAWPRWLTLPDNNPTTTTRQQPGDNLQPTYAHTHTHTYTYKRIYIVHDQAARARVGHWLWPQSQRQTQSQSRGRVQFVYTKLAQKITLIARNLLPLSAHHTVPWWECMQH